MLLPAIMATTTIMAHVTLDNPPASNEAPSGTLPLAGPAAAQYRKMLTIVRRDFRARVIRPECPPEQAAIDCMELTKEERAAVRAVLDRRTIMIDAIVSEHYELLMRLDGAFRVGSSIDKLAALHDSLVATDDLRSFGSLQSQIASVLPGAEVSVFLRILDDYWRAIADEKQVAEHRRLNVIERIGAMTEERLQSFGRELAASFQRQLSSGDFLFRIATRGLELTGQQAGRIRELCGQFAEAVVDDAPTKRQLAMLIIGALAWLNPDQQAGLIQNLQALGS